MSGLYNMVSVEQTTEQAMKANGIEVDVRGPYTKHYAPWGRTILTLEERFCFWKEGDRRRACVIVQNADGDFVTGTYYPSPLAKTVRGVLRKVVGKNLCPLT